ncbi:PREDICTED: uncharacterized protein LOC101309854 isoform X1 [Fragaria vesca subsp. vesca]|uniref:uncharacterized protein LOC101309854 isoform X1 n=1 Tax=Fragaria vesca subsp. vesca TaxID=101020 RepID=UPI0002C304BA|nr:PREDICTED: uncharacterized protein LOC101309854 isoform X1 [Fragaria vesca subsp. vesca]
MVYHQRKKGEKPREEEDDEECQTLAMECASSSYYKRSTSKLFTFLFICILSCSFILAPHLIFSSVPTFSLSKPPEGENEGPSTAAVTDAKAPLYSSMSNAAGAICCDRSSMRSDVCTMKGDVRTHSPSSSIFVYASQDQAVKNEEDLQHEKIKPYTRKWETIIMDTIVELDLIAKKRTLIMNHHNCDVQHDVPAVFFSTGGYTGNVYHEFNDGIMPLYITSQHFNKKVVFVILEFHNWWVMKYSDILSHLSDYPVIDFHTDERVHCFPEAIVGLKIHDELTVDSSLMEGNKSIVDFRELLDRAYQPQIRSLMHMHEHAKVSDVLSKSKRPSRIRRNVQERAFNNEPKLVIISRNGSRAITNENLLVKMAEKIGFHVQVLRPDSRTMLAEIYWALNSSDVMIGVHGAAMTHFLFMKPGSVFIQVIPLGIEWAAEAYYGEPAKKLGLNYIGYQILTKESSLCDKYNKDDPVLKDPRSVTRKGWQYTKMIYLEGQTVRLDLPRFRKQLVGAYNYTIDRLKQQRSNIQSH